MKLSKMILAAAQYVGNKTISISGEHSRQVEYSTSATPDEIHPGPSPCRDTVHAHTREKRKSLLK